MSFFPQIVQGPIPRYKSISTQLFEGHKFDYDAMVLGLVRLGWGFFLKFMIADKAAVVVNTVFDNSSAYTGAYLWVAAFLYSIQIYADFAGCVAMCKGVAELFGIQLADNFRQPYFSVSIREFWRRWHISFSSWLKDYIYIPLGGSRKGKIRRFLNVIITFAVSGLWHGGNLHFIAWGLIHAGYQIVGDFLNPVWKKITKSSESDAASTATVILNRCITFVLVMLSWVMFRAVSLREGLQMYLSMFTHFNPWILVDSSLLRLGLCWQEWIVLTVSILVLLGVSIMKEQGKDVRALLAGQNLVVRWAVYFIFIWSIWIFGTYGFGFDANAFIYGGF